MPYAPTPCARTNCNSYAVSGGLCLQHKPVWQGTTRKQRLPRDWNTRRGVVLKRDANRCYKCGAVATQVDHLLPGDDHSLRNLAAICYDCHKAKSALEGAQAASGNRPKRNY